MKKEKEKVDEGETVNELDALKLENESLKSELAAKNNIVIGMEQKLTEKDSEIVTLKQSLDKAIQDTAEITKKLEEAVAAYKELAVQANPGLVAEMIKGNTIEEINESLKSAQALVEKVKQELGAESARVRVPAGAPQRIPLDLSTLSSREKIKYAMESG
jgi:chromosome segregation ATPase